MSIMSWINKNFSMLSLAIGSVEKNALNQTGEQLYVPVTQERRHTQGMIADSLKHGEVTQEVINLRWRTYKILHAAEGYSSDIIGYTEDGYPITKTAKKDRKFGLRKIKMDMFDNFDLEMVIDNSEITTSLEDSMDNTNISLLEKANVNVSSKDGDTSATHGEINGMEYFATTKTEKPIQVERNTIPKFKIETYTKKLNVRIINEKQRLLELYVSKYPDEYNRTTRLFISEIKKTMENPILTSTIDISKIGFITYKSIGVDDFLEYQYNKLSFDKIIEFNGYYVIKFIGEIYINGVSILEKHRVSELDEKYNKKEKK